MLRFVFVLIIMGHTLLFAVSDKELGVTIDLSGKQRMLTQRMAKEALLIMLDRAADVNRKRLRANVRLFDKTLQGLIGGDRDLGLVPVQDAAIQKQLAHVAKLFAPFKASVAAIISGKATDADFNQVVLKKNMILLKEMNKAVYMYAALTDQAENQALKMATNINLAGKQRMLTQRMAKDLLIASMASPKDRVPYVRDFKACQALFDRTIAGLIDGDKKLHLIKTELPNIRDQLEKVQAIWKLRQRTFAQAVENQNALAHAVESLDTLMTEMNTAVRLYTQSIVRQKLRKRLSSIVNAYIEEKGVLRSLVNISGKQRMLTQRMSKLAIQCALGLKRSESCAAMGDYRKEYARALVLFVRGDSARKIPPVRDQSIQEQIKKILMLWKPFSQAVRKLSTAQGREKTALLYILRHEHALLTASDRLVKLYETENPDQDALQKARLRVVNVAGRQRMLTQKMTKEKLLWLKLGSDKQEKRMFQTIKLFETSLAGLIHGSAKMGLPKVTNVAIKNQLKKVEAIWKKIKPLYIKKILSSKELMALIRVNPVLLQEMHRAVGMMEKAIEY